MKALALDFDGVISDSAPESFVVAIRTWAGLRPDSNLNGRIALLRRLDREAVQSARTYSEFLELMPLGNRAEDYAVALDVLERGVSVSDQASYDAERSSQDAEFLLRFHKAFYREREALSRSDPAGWLRLIAPYPEFVELLRRRAGDVMLAIATAKDRRSVELLLRDYGISDLFGRERLLDKEVGVSKCAHLEQLQHTLGIPFEEITFIDDKVNHLDSVAGLGVRCVLAGWGYNGPREHELAREHGHLVCQIGDVEAKLFASARPA